MLWRKYAKTLLQLNFPQRKQNLFYFEIKKIAEISYFNVADQVHSLPPPPHLSSRPQWYKRNYIQIIFDTIYQYAIF